MKRDMELIRRMLQAIEDDSFPEALPDVDPQILRGHMLLLVDGGLAEVSLRGLLSLPIDCVIGLPIRLTWKGHDYLRPRVTGTFINEFGLATR